MGKKYRQLSSRVSRERSKKYGGKLEAVGDLLYRFDPISLVPFGVPADEYDGEAEVILGRLPACRSAEDVQTMMHRVFVERFNRAVAGEAHRYLGLSVAIWNLSQKPDTTTAAMGPPSGG